MLGGVQAAEKGSSRIVVVVDVVARRYLSILGNNRCTLKCCLSYVSDQASE